MTVPDLINGLFESLAGLMILQHCRVLLRDRQVKGVSLLAIAFFTLWGYWNLYYYPSLGQWLSFVGGLMIVLANTIYVTLLIYFIRRGRKE